MQPSNTVEGFRLSPQQRRLWMLKRNARDHAASFCSQLVVSLQGELDREALRQAIEAICQRHEVLRTAFPRISGVSLPVQSVGEMAFSWETQDLNGSVVTEIEELLDRERRRTFDYENGPIVRAKLFSLEPQRHVLSITMPALCADRCTLSNLFFEIAKGAGKEEPFQYAQFSDWQNSLSEEADAEKGREYWSKQDLSTASLVLPGQSIRQTRGEQDTSRQQHTSGEHRPIRVRLSSECTHRIANLAEQPGTTSATVLLAAWQTLWWRLTQKSVVIGNLSDGRSYDLLEHAFGLFARVLPVCVRLNDGLRFAEVIAQVQNFQRESEEWQDYFDSATPFSFGFEYAVTPRPTKRGALEFAVYDQHAEFEPFGVKLLCVSSGSDLDLVFGYDARVFDEAYVQQLAEKFETLVEAALAHPEATIEELEIVSAAEQQRVVFEWNNTERDYALEHTIHERFERQVRQSPDAVALVFQDEVLTFAELDASAAAVAQSLLLEGVVTETAVGVCIEPSLEMIVAVLGVLKAGGAYVPIDPRNPPRRIEELAQDAGVALVVTKDRVNRSASERRLDFETDTRPSDRAASSAQSSAKAENLAYVIYTSGSTGRPKGVMVQHRSVVNLAAALRDEAYADLEGRLRVGLSAPLAFDASVKQIVQLLSGHTLHILPEELRLDARKALDYIDRNAIDVLDCTPSQLKLLIAAGLNSSKRQTAKLILIGGEALDESAWSQLASNRSTQFFNVYGPTECTVDATWTVVTNGLEPNETIQPTTEPSIGRPIPNTRAYILDQNLKPTGVHVTGELYLGGAGLARGYLNAPNLTAERFIPDALSGTQGARLYRTGDLARYTANRSITFIGRNDAQVKLRGHRIELGEIENALRQHDHVRDAVVVARADKSDTRLVGYIVARNGNTTRDVTPDTTELRKHLSERLPEYMLPSFLVVLDELPLTRNGKVDLHALPAPETVKTAREENYLAPRNDIENAITRVWQDALGLERVGVNDNFFDAGGHSLLMVQVHNKLSEMFDKQISIVEMFAKPTISALAEHFNDTKGHKPTFAKVMDRAARRRHAVAMKSVP
jgi:amino acid adenylation domain-containing protein